MILALYDVVSWIEQNIVWGIPLLALLLAAGIILTIRLRGIQFRKVGKSLKLMVQNEGGGTGEVSSFGALCISMAATLGTGKIVGVATAIYFGGPGAVFWCWITGVLGIATKYAESYIAVKHRVKHSNGEYSGGAMTVFEHLGKKGLAKIFAYCAAVAAFGIGCATQSSAIVNSLNNTFAIPNWISGLVICAITALVIFGGVKSIAKVCERLVPIMSIIYVVGCIVILLTPIVSLEHPNLIELISQSLPM